jgi:hypothetical protein
VSRRVGPTRHCIEIQLGQKVRAAIVAPAANAVFRDVAPERDVLGAATALDSTEVLALRISSFIRRFLVAIVTGNLVPPTVGRFRRSCCPS